MNEDLCRDPVALSFREGVFSFGEVKILPADSFGLRLIVEDNREKKHVEIVLTLTESAILGRALLTYIGYEE